VLYSEEAKAVFKEMDSISIDKYNSSCRMGPVWMKSVEKAKRISLILASSENPNSPFVSKENAAYACRLMNFLLNAFNDKVLGRIASNDEESKKQHILLKILDAGPDGIRKSELTKKTQWVTKVGRDHMLADLIQGEFIVVVDTNKRNGIVSTQRGRGYTKLRYWAVEHYNHEIHGAKSATPTE
ncbi:hypothetical protein LCGC14_1621920, partial [marine sediment metagenome]